ncbi:hypothetical protein QBC39DRAFT_285261 [Podospora conica]|nr:hypothetical protein QBC39DRAFT_285261 [Schizothecium conicum]
MLRRPPGQVAPTGNGKYLLALAVILLPWLQLVDAQQQHSQHSAQSPLENDRHVLDSSPVTSATPLTRHPVVETSTQARRKSILSDGAGDDANHHSRSATYNPYDARATNQAPDDSVVAVAPSKLRTDSVGLSQQKNARFLKDWEVEDYVLLATVDGDLHAADRQTGHVRWHLKADHPMVETRHFRINRSEVDEDYDPVDHYLWVVEPTRDGELYLWRPDENGLGLTKMALTMKKIVEDMLGTHDKVNGLVYTGDKKTTLVTVDAATGVIMKKFGSSGTFINKVESQSCLKPNAIADGECTNAGTITLARTEYTVSIQRIEGSPIASLKYSEWGPNIHDNDLIQQNFESKDGRYITGRHDGSFYGFDLSRSSRDQRPIFIKSLSTPVARVFDVLHRRDASGTDPDIVVLPQPPIPADEETAKYRTGQVLVNQTEAGSWYALSGARYPLVVQASQAPIHGTEWRRIQKSGIAIDEDFMSKAMVGIHRLPAGRGNMRESQKTTQALPMLDAPKPLDMIEPSMEETNPPPVPSNLSNSVQTLMALPEATADKIVDLFSNPVAIFLIFAFAAVYWDRILRFFKRKALGWKPLGKSFSDQIEVKPTISTVETDTKPPAVDSEGSATPLEIGKPVAQTEAASQNAPVPEDTVKDSPVPVPVPAPVDANGAADAAIQDAPAPASATVTDIDPTAAPTDGNNGQEVAKKKKGHRGRRGGTKHKSKKNAGPREGSQSRDDDPPVATVDEAVNKAKQLGAVPPLEPDILTVSNGIEEVSGPTLKMGLLEVNTDQQLGTGSNGTVVFAGKWDGRDVAVKRMLVEFNEIASHETRLLRESDDHPNVIRYYAQQQRAAFLYIALELCQASLADIVQRPSQFRELAQAGERDMQNVLYQITNGLDHLHSLRIVHRDLKPQNILVNLGKDKRPRLLVSDFGLCKKLEGGESSFGATTAHAAGTSGWRAPELLLDDDGPVNTSMTLDPHSSLHSTSGSGLLGAETPGPNQRRVTRAIDIFSLGLVFFYVLTKGNHPFDCGDRYMREVNIRKGKYNLDSLDSLGDFAHEAKDLISAMLNANPRQRPTTKDVMAHPFFWNAKKRLAFLCDVSDHFEKEQRDPPSPALATLEDAAPRVIESDFLRQLPREFVDSLGKQRKYTGTRMLDLLRALRNKRNHYEDMPESLRRAVGSLPDGYLSFWTTRFPNLLLACWNVVWDVEWDGLPRFKEYYEPAGV